MKKLNAGISVENGNYLFLGQKISEYGIDTGKVDFQCLAKCGNMVMNNNIVQTLENAGIYPELLQGDEYDEETGEYVEIYQYYIIDDTLKEIIEDYFPNELLYHYDDEDLTLWAITHFGTSWDYVPTEYNIFIDGEGED